MLSATTDISEFGVCIAYCIKKGIQINNTIFKLLIVDKILFNWFVSLTIYAFCSIQSRTSINNERGWKSILITTI